MTEGLVRTSRAPSLSCAAAGLRKAKERETMRRIENGSTEVVMEPTLAKQPVLRGFGMVKKEMIVFVCLHIWGVWSVSKAY